MDTNTMTTFVKNLFDQVYVNNKIEKLGDFYATNVKLHDAAFQPGTQGLNGLREMEELYLKAFPNKKAQIEDICVVGDKVIVRWKVQGTHKGSFTGIAPTNKNFVISGISVYRFENGKIAELWQSWDRLGLLEQLGEIRQSYALSK